MAKSKRRASSCVQFKASGDCKLPCGWVNSVKRRPHCRMRRSSKKDSMYRTPSRSNLTNATTRSNQSKRSNRSDRSTDSVVFNSISRKLFQSASPQSSLSGSTSPPRSSRSSPAASKSSPLIYLKAVSPRFLNKVEKLARLEALNKSRSEALNAAAAQIPKPVPEHIRLAEDERKKHLEKVKLQTAEIYAKLAAMKNK